MLLLPTKRYSILSMSAEAANAASSDAANGAVNGAENDEFALAALITKTQSGIKQLKKDSAAPEAIQEQVHMPYYLMTC